MAKKAPNKMTLASFPNYDGDKVALMQAELKRLIGSAFHPDVLGEVEFLVEGEKELHLIIQHTRRLSKAAEKQVRDFTDGFVHGYLAAARKHESQKPTVVAGESIEENFEDSNEQARLAGV